MSCAIVAAVRALPRCRLDPQLGLRRRGACRGSVASRSGAGRARSPRKAPAVRRAAPCHVAPPWRHPRALGAASDDKGRAQGPRTAGWARQGSHLPPVLARGKRSPRLCTPRLRLAKKGARGRRARALGQHGAHGALPEGCSTRQCVRAVAGCARGGSQRSLCPRRRSARLPSSWPGWRSASCRRSPVMVRAACRGPAQVPSAASTELRRCTVLVVLGTHPRVLSAINAPGRVARCAAPCRRRRR